VTGRAGVDREVPVSPRFGIGGGSESGKGGSAGADSWDNEEVPPQSDWKADPDYWRQYHPHFNSKNNGGETEEEEDKNKETCLAQNKGGVDELPDSRHNRYYFNIENSSAKSTIKSAWKDTEARKEIVGFLNDMDLGNLKPRNVKNFKSFKSLTELKSTKVRMLVRNRKNGQPDEIVAIFLRPNMEKITTSFSDQYKRKK